MLLEPVGVDQTKRIVGGVLGDGAKESFIVDHGVVLCQLYHPWCKADPVPADTGWREQVRRGSPS
jgi:hypothetical protein